MKGILEVIKLIYGSKALSKILGTRTNVIRLPDNELKQYTKSDLNIEAASDKLAQKAKADMKELLADYPRMNDAEKLIFEGNLRRLGNKLGVTEKGPAADVLEFGTGEKVSPEGIMSLTEKAGQKNPPTTLMGKLESRIKQLEASGEDLSKLKGKTYDEFMKDITQGQKSMRKLEDEGLVRATAREIIGRDIKSGKIKLPKEIEQDIVQGGGEPINVFRKFYGEDALEQLDSMIPEFKNMYSPREAADAATKKFNFEFKADRPPGSISIEDAKKTEQEFNIIPADSEEGKIITEKLIGKPKAPVTELMTAEKIISDMKNMDPMDAMKEANKVLKKEGKYKNLQEKDVERIMEDTNDFIFGRDIPEDPEGFAKGGRVGFNEGSKLTDYLKTNISAKTSSSSPEEGVKVKQEILDGIISLNIPLSKKLKLLGDLKFGKNRAKVDLSELGKKYGIDLGEEVYKDKYFSPGLGAEYTTDEGTKFNLMVNPEDKGGSISVSRSFATGGRVGYQAGGVTTKGIVEVIPKNLPQTLSEAIKQFGREAVYGKVISSGGGDEPEYRAPGLNQYYNSMSLEDPYEAGRLKEQYRPAIGPAGTVLPLKTTPTPAEQLQTTYTANVTPSTSSGLYPNNPFYSSTFGVPTESVQPKTSKLYPNNPFYSSTFGVPTEEDTSKEMSSDISVLYDQYMKNLGYQSGGRVGYSDGTKPSAEENTPSQEIINRMIAQIKQLSKRGVDVNTIKDIVGASDQMIKDVLGKASGGSMSKGLDYLTGIERRGYANGDYAVQAGIKNYLGKQKTATVPIKWKSGKGDSHPDTELAYITKPEKDLLIKLDMHNSMPDGEPNIGPAGLISLNSGGDGGAGGAGGGGGGDGGTDASSPGDTGGAGGADGAGGNDAGGASGGSGASGNDTSPGATGGAGGDPNDPGSEASGGSGASGNDTSPGATGGAGGDPNDPGSEASGGSGASGNDTSPGATGGAGGDPNDPGSEASGGTSGGGVSDTGDMGSEAANVSSTSIWCCFRWCR
jgi:hypothetical protein